MSVTPAQMFSDSKLKPRVGSQTALEHVDGKDFSSLNQTMDFNISSLDYFKTRNRDFCCNHLLLSINLLYYSFY